LIGKTTGGLVGPHERDIVDHS